MKNKGLFAAIASVVIFVGLFAYLKMTTDIEKPAAAPSAPTETVKAENSFRVVPADTSLLIKPHSISKGSEQARVTIVEFLDPECEACAAMYPYAKKVHQEFEKDIRFVVRYMPYHGNSRLVAGILEGTRAEGKFWEALELLFSTQRQWADHHNPNPDLIPEILKPLGLNMKKIMADAKAGKYEQLITQDQQDGQAAGVNGTPTFFVNGNKLEDLGYEPLRDAVRNYLK